MNFDVDFTSISDLARIVEKQIDQNRLALEQYENDRLRREARNSFIESNGRTPDQEFDPEGSTGPV